MVVYFHCWRRWYVLIACYYGINSLQEKERRIFLNRDDIEETVHEFGTANSIEGLCAHAREAEGKVTGGANEYTPLNDLGCNILEADHHRLQDECDSEDFRHKDESLKIGLCLGAEGEIGHHLVDGEWKRQIKNAGEKGIDY